jgi:hypothetical protein
LCQEVGQPVTTRNYLNPNKVQDFLAQITLA